MELTSCCWPSIQYKESGTNANEAYGASKMGVAAAVPGMQARALLSQRRTEDAESWKAKNIEYSIACARYANARANGSPELSEWHKNQQTSALSRIYPDYRGLYSYDPAYVDALVEWQEGLAPSLKSEAWLMATAILSIQPGYGSDDGIMVRLPHDETIFIARGDGADGGPAMYTLRDMKKIGCWPRTTPRFTARDVLVDAWREYELKNDEKPRESAGAHTTQAGLSGAWFRSPVVRAAAVRSDVALLPPLPSTLAWVSVADLQDRHLREHPLLQQAKEKGLLKNEWRIAVNSYELPAAALSPPTA
ncbi:hypothetical protein [Bordetella sp. LUAb4]|uniref:hypothetical protein n=1 Tax=Bordetella sp. LUAb4 TaxID=2843195 RepID=UPI001E2D0EB3|nr:hypothetical protein [Bordetella sp. LUAb4]